MTGHMDQPTSLLQVWYQKVNFLELAARPKSLVMGAPLWECFFFNLPGLTQCLSGEMPTRRGPLEIVYKLIGPK